MERKPFDVITTRTDHPLDQGWSWVVMMAAFGSMFLVIGYQRSLGLLFVLFQEKHGFSSAQLAAVNGTQALVYCFSTMFVMNYLLKKISIRTSALVGACLEAIGVMSCSFSNDIISLIMFNGVFFGLGHSMLYCPTILIVSQYFHVHRSIATAIALSGSSAGGISFPYITRFFLGIFGLEGTLLLLGALLFQQCVFFALYQPIIIDSDTEKNTPSSADLADTEQTLINSGASNGILELDLGDISIQDKSTNEDDILYTQKHDLMKENVLLKNVKNDLLLTRLASSQVIHSASNEKPDLKKRLYSSHNTLNQTARSNPSVFTRSSNPSLFTRSKQLLNILGSISIGMENVPYVRIQTLMAPITRNQDEEEKRENEDKGEEEVEEDVSLMENGVKGPIPKKDIERNNSKEQPSSDNVSKESKQNRWIPEIMRLPTFWLIAAYKVGGYIAAGCPPVFIPALAKERGLTDDDGAFFLMISAVTGFASRIVAGVTLHLKLIEVCNLALVSLGLNMVFFFLTVVFHSFATILSLSLVWGFCSSLFYTLDSLVVIEVLGMDHLASSMGFYAVMTGFATSVSFPFAGWLYDQHSSYSASFVYFGVVSLLAGLALMSVQLPKYKIRARNTRL